MDRNNRSEYSAVAVIGAGAWGTTVAQLLAENGCHVRLWARESFVMEQIAQSGFNDTYLPGIQLSRNIAAEPDRAKLLGGVPLVITAVPVQYLRNNLEPVKSLIEPDAIVLNLAKGLEAETMRRPSEIIRDILGGNRIAAVLSGPNIAVEVAARLSSKAVVSASDFQRIEKLRRLFCTSYFDVSGNPDLVGVEIGGALKNVIAIAAGIGDGLGYGHNIKSYIVTRGLSEIVMIGVMMGSNPETFMGLSGMGDIMTTCFSPQSRNRRLGEMMGQGRTLAEAQHSLGCRVAEGVYTTQAVHSLKTKLDIEVPIMSAIYRTLYENQSAKEAFADMLACQPIHEFKR